MCVGRTSQRQNVSWCKTFGLRPPAHVRQYIHWLLVPDKALMLCPANSAAICPTDRDYSTLGSVLLACNMILDEPLMFWHDWLTKTYPIKATYGRKWDSWGGGGLCICDSVQGGGAEGGGVVSEDSRCLSRKSEHAGTQETDEQCVRALWFMDRAQFSGCWGFRWNKRRNSLLGNNWQLCQFTVTFTAIIQISNCQKTWEKGFIKKAGDSTSTVQMCFRKANFTSSYPFTLVIIKYIPRHQLLCAQAVTT